MGKVPPKSLIKVFARHLGVPTDRLISGPAIGEDAAIIDMGDRVLVLATDPITAAIENVGWLSVHINANDIATCGAKPLWYLCSILLPEKANEELFEVIMRQVDRAARELDVSVIGGHSEVTLGLNRSIIIGFMVGEAAKDKYVSSSGARPGDEVILTKQAGIEGTAILATDLAKILRGKIGGETLESARNFIRKISVVKEAMIAVDVGGIDAMHDPTEGGLINGLWELAEASRVGITVYEEKIPIAYETKSICKALNIDPLQVMGSGALLIVVKSNKVNNVAFALQSEGIMTSVIGKVTRLENGRRMIKGNGSSIELAPPEQDHVYKVLEEFSIKSL
jgi:hydrogenase expression/formation protein HypE